MTNPRYATPRAAYVHVPFCRHRCGYCNFTVAAGKDELIDAYLQALAVELSWLGARPHFDDGRLLLEVPRGRLQSWLHSAHRFSSFNNQPYLFDPIILDSRTVVNARLGIENVELGEGTLRSSLWVRNAFDEDYPTFGINFGALGTVTEQYGEPRTFGLDVTWEF